MQCSRRTVILTISTLFIVFFLIFRLNPTELVFNNEDNYLEIINNEIILYDNKGKRIDSYKLKDKVYDYSMVDLDGDDSKELAILTKRSFKIYGSEIVILKLEDEIIESYREDFSELKPWKLASGDIDGDGRDELSIGVYKETPLHQIMAKRPFIYHYEDNRLLPKWRGSRLSKPFDDYCFYDIDKDEIDELISIEVLQDGEKVINTYKWKGFGFEGFLKSKSFDDISNLRIESKSALVKIIEKEESYLGEIKIQDNSLIIERVNSE